MIPWIAQHSSALQVLLNGLMVLIWVLYLQVFLVSFRRQHQSDILITIGAGAGLKARCFITNLGLEPIYLLEVLVRIQTNSETHEVNITDRTEMTDEELNNPAEATNQGPLPSARFIDIGSFETLVNRACSRDDTLTQDAELSSISISAVVVTAATSALAGASRKYLVKTDDHGRVDLQPTEIMAEQIRTRRGRRRLQQRLSSRLAS